MREKGMAPIFLVLAVVVVATIVAAYYFGKQSAILTSVAQQLVVSTQQVQPTATTRHLTQTSIEDESANLKLYTFDNNIQSLQFKYPSEWKHYRDSGSVGYDDIGNGYYSIAIGFQSNTNNLPLEEFVNTISSYNKTATKIPVIVGSKKGIQINNQENGVYYSVVYCQYDDKTILEIDASGNRNANQELLTKILSTFQF